MTPRLNELTTIIACRPPYTGGEIIPESRGAIISEQRGGFIGIGSQPAYFGKIVGRSWCLITMRGDGRSIGLSRNESGRCPCHASP
ncbi:hypothetical protein CDO26_35005 (plasmid) [Sinorhizobium meliloti]|nr:hypothetical protein CDO26_35005 [Sinorhizobium meliloti]